MEIADKIEWYGDSELRLIERAIEREDWGNYNGITNLGKRLIQEVQDKISEISQNLNLYQLRDGEERVAPLASSDYILIYKKEYFKDISKVSKNKLLIIDIRKSY